eukprot:525680_1
MKRKLTELNESLSKHSSPKRRKLNNTDDIKEKETLSTHEIMTQLAKLFENIDEPNDVCICGDNQSLPLIPGLYVNTIGEIPLPICDEQLQKILSINANKQRICELNFDQFHFKNPQWNNQIQTLVHSVGKNLGCDNDSITFVEANCGKLIIYNKDTDFDFDMKTTQQADDKIIFAKLIVQLPSKYIMTNDKPVLEITHEDDVYTFGFGSTIDKPSDSHSIEAEWLTGYGKCRYDIYYASYLANNKLVKQRHKIKNGTRVVVTYNLYWNGPINIMPTISDFSISNAIDNILCKWDKNAHCPLAIYSENEYVMEGLKESQFVHDNNLIFFTASVERKVTAYDSGSGLLAHCKMGYDADYDMCNWEESEREETIVWYDENENEFDNGKYIDIDLQKYCIGYPEYDDEWEIAEQEHEGYKSAMQFTTYTIDITIFLNKELLSTIEQKKNRMLNEITNEDLRTAERNIKRTLPIGSKTNVIKLTREMMRRNLSEMIVQKSLNVMHSKGEIEFRCSGRQVYRLK